jgi:hypothetical protein
MRTPIACFCVFFCAAAFAQQPQWRAPRTADGHPDLQGMWTSATITPLERPDEYGVRRALTVDEAARLEHAEASLVSNSAKPTDLQKQLPGDCKDFGRGCGYNNFWLDRGSQVVAIDGEKRTSLLIDPPDGKIPPLTAERQKSMAARPRQNFDGPEARPLGERCIVNSNSAGPPMLNYLYNNNYEFVQTAGALVMRAEMNNYARIVRIGGHHSPAAIRTLHGDSIGHWDGDTLVVETTGFHPLHASGVVPLTEQGKVTERLTRVSPSEILYEFTVEDPGVYARPWRAEMTFNATRDRVFEYACHEGNYALPGILAGAREQEKRQAANAEH